MFSYKLLVRDEIQLHVAVFSQSQVSKRVRDINATLDRNRGLCSLFSAEFPLGFSIQLLKNKSTTLAYAQRDDTNKQNEHGYQEVGSLRVMLYAASHALLY